MKVPNYLVTLVALVKFCVAVCVQMLCQLPSVRELFSTFRTDMSLGKKRKNNTVLRDFEIYTIQKVACLAFHSTSVLKASAADAGVLQFIRHLAKVRTLSHADFTNKLKKSPVVDQSAKKRMK